MRIGWTDHRAGHLALATSLALTLVGCAGSEERRAAPTGPGRDAAARGDAGPAARMDGGEAPRVDASEGTDAGACRSIVRSAETEQRPADVILVVDSSSSMGRARRRIAEVLNAELDAVLSAGGLDYRVILLASLDRIQIGAPLTEYDPPRFFPVELFTGSGRDQNFTKLLDRWDSWGPLLRPDALHHFIHFTDAKSGGGGEIAGYPDRFDEVLYDLHPEIFGTSGADGKLTYHAVVGLRGKSDGSPYEPTDPVQDRRCSNDDFDTGAGRGFQRLAIRTGGLRYPVCDYGGYAAVFRRIADVVVDSVPIECSYDIPEPPEDLELDLDTVVLRYNPGEGDPELFRQATPAACDGSSFVLDEGAGRLELCPESCARVQEDAEAAITVEFGCDPTLL